MLRKHIEQQHPTVQLPEDGKKVRLYRNEGTPPLPIPPAPEQPVSAVFPTPEGYQPNTEDDIVAGSFEYVPTPVPQYSSSATMAKFAEPQPSTTTFSSKGMIASSTVPGPSVSKQEETASTSYDPKSDLDYEFGSSSEYELLEESAKANSSSVSEHSTGTQDQDTRWVISMDEYCSRKVVDKKIEEMQEAVANRITTAGYQSLLEDLQSSFSNPVESLNELTKRIRLTLEPCTVETSGSKEIGEAADPVQDRGREHQEEAQQPGEVAESLKAAEECLLETERVAEVDRVYGDNLEMCEPTEECLVETESSLAGGDCCGHQIGLIYFIQYFQLVFLWNAFGRPTGVFHGRFTWYLNGILEFCICLVMT